MSQVGLVPDPAQTKASNLALEKLREEIVLVEGRRIKNSYMKTLGTNAVILATLVSIVAGVAYLFTQLPWIGSVWAVAIGSLAGTWVSFGARKFEICFEDLASLESDKMNPWIRLVYICVASLIFMLFMNTGLIEVKIGDIDTASALVNMKSALVIGVMCGLVESKIGVNVYQKAVGLIGD